MAVYPMNDQGLVERIGKLLEVDLDTVFSLKNVDGKCGNGNLANTTVVNVLYK